MITPHATVNGRTVAFGNLPTYTSALDWIRDLGFTGAKEGCAEGECGACASRGARPRPPGDNTTEWVCINACLIPAASLEEQDVLTAEGLGSPDDLHPVQREMALRGGSQCGYCTPGFVCSMAAEYYRAGRAADAHHGAADEPEHGANGFDLHAMSGNLCRCTGYRPIRDAAYALGEPAADDPIAQRHSEAAPVAPATRIANNGAEYVRPADLTAALELIHQRPDAVLVAGSTDWGVDVNLAGRRASFVVGLDRIPARAGRRRQPRRGQSVLRGGHRPDPGPARDAGRRRCVHSRCGTHPDRTGAPPRRSNPVVRRSISAVRVATDPQRRDTRRQSRHGLTDRRLPARPARARSRPRARFRRRR